MKRVAYLGGVNGSGKSAIADVVSERYSDITIFHFTRLFLKYLNTKSRARIQRLPDGQQRRIRTKIFNSKLSNFSTPFGLVEGHYIIPRTGGKSHFLLDDPYADRFDMFMHIVASPKTILEQMHRDRKELGRRLGYFERDVQILEAIRRRQELSVSMTKKRAKELEIPFLIIRHGTKAAMAKRIHSALIRS